MINVSLKYFSAETTQSTNRIKHLMGELCISCNAFCFQSYHCILHLVVNAVNLNICSLSWRLYFKSIKTKKRCIRVSESFQTIFLVEFIFHFINTQTHHLVLGEVNLSVLREGYFWIFHEIGYALHWRE